MAPDTTPPGRDLLSEEDVADGLERLPGWSGDQRGIERTLEAPTFPGAIAIVGAVALVAEAMDHHPDIDIRYRRVRLALSTHSSGGVTETDLVAAARMEEAAAAIITRSDGITEGDG